jgi:hypothetical protein
VSVPLPTPNALLIEITNIKNEIKERKEKYLKYINFLDITSHYKTGIKSEHSKREKVRGFCYNVHK